MRKSLLLAVCLGTIPAWAAEYIIEATARGFVSDDPVTQNNGASPGNNYTAGSNGGITPNLRSYENDKFYIGAYRGQCEQRFNGDVDEVRIFNRALSAAEVQRIFRATP